MVLWSWTLAILEVIKRWWVHGGSSVQEKWKRSSKAHKYFQALHWMVIFNVVRMCPEGYVLTLIVCGGRGGEGEL